MEQDREQEIEQTPDPAFIQGMNEGYLMAKYMPEVADGLYKIVSDSERMQGFKAGREEFMKEKIAEMMKSWDHKDKQPDKFAERDRDIDKAIDDIERERE